SIGAAALTAVSWGAGHGLTMLVVGGAIVLSGFTIPRPVGLSLELGVALMLIVLGLVNVSGIVHEARGKLASSNLDRGNGSSRRRPENRRLYESGLYRAVRPMAIGVVHGLAGSGAMTLLL